MITRVAILKELQRRRAFQELSRRHIFYFTKYTFKKYKNENWHHRLVFDYYERAIRREILRLMVFAPPRHMKTEGLERAIAWSIGNDPDTKAMGCSYAMTKASKTSRNIKSILKAKTFSEIFPKFKERGFFKGGVSDTQAMWEVGNGYRGSYLAAGVGGAITGEGFNVGVIDDPVKSREEAESPTYQEKTFEWYEGTFLNRQDESDSVIIITNTRWNRKDLAGKILERDGIKEYNGRPPSEGCPEWNGQPDGLWTILSLPALMDEDAYDWKHPQDPREVGEALWPQRFPVSHLKQFQLNRYDWASLFQQRPKPKGGNMINRAWFRIVDDFPRGGKLVRFWDLAGTPKVKSKQNDPDFTAGGLVTYVEGILYIIDVRAVRGTPAEVDALITQTATLDDARYGRVTQYWEEEGGAGGKHISSHYEKALMGHLRRAYRVGKSKEWYIDLLANKAETGNVCCVKGKWLSDQCDGNTFFDEAEEFPKGSHDDRIDAVAKASHILTGNPPSVTDSLKGK